MKARFWRVTWWGKSRAPSMERQVFTSLHSAREVFDKVRLSGMTCTLEHPGPDGWPGAGGERESQGVSFDARVSA